LIVGVNKVPDEVLLYGEKKFAEVAHGEQVGVCNFSIIGDENLQHPDER
jgi:hypothetical protein